MEVQRGKFILIFILAIGFVIFYAMRPKLTSGNGEATHSDTATVLYDSKVSPEVGKREPLAARNTPPVANPFQRYEGCRFKEDRWNDGDSFHVIMPDGKEQILRLYFVDTPEADTTYLERIDEQAAYFGVSRGGAVQIGKRAKEVTREALLQPFAVQTRWRRALGRSTLPRYYALITTSSGRDLGELLVERGLARIYGTRTTLPDGSGSEVYLDRVRKIEVRSKERAQGGWEGQVPTGVRLAPDQHVR